MVGEVKCKHFQDKHPTDAASVISGCISLLLCTPRKENNIWGWDQGSLTSERKKLCTLKSRARKSLSCLTSSFSQGDTQSVGSIVTIKGV